MLYRWGALLGSSESSFCELVCGYLLAGGARSDMAFLVVEEIYKPSYSVSLKKYGKIAYQQKDCSILGTPYYNSQYSKTAF